VRLLGARFRRSAWAAAAAVAVVAVAGGVAATHKNGKAEPSQPTSSPASSPAPSPVASPAVAAPAFVSAIGVRPDGTGAAVVGPCQLPGGTCDQTLRRTANAGKTLDSAAQANLPIGPTAPEPRRVAAAGRFALYVWAPGTSQIAWSATNGYVWKQGALQGQITDVDAAPDRNSVWIATESCPVMASSTGCAVHVLSGTAGADPRSFRELRLPVARGIGPVSMSRGAAGSAVVLVGHLATQDAAVSDGLFVTDDDGRTWTRRDLPCQQDPPDFWRPVDVSLAADGAVWALCASDPSTGGQHKQAYVSERRGAFRKAGSLPDRGYAASVGAMSRTTAWVSRDRGPVMGTSDGGRTWSAVTDDSDFFGPVQVLPDGTALAAGQADGHGAVWMGRGTGRWTAHGVSNPGPFAGFSDCNSLQPGDDLDFGALTCNPDEVQSQTMDCSTGIYVHLVRPNRGDLEGITGVSPTWRAVPTGYRQYGGRTPFAFNNCAEEEAGGAAFVDPGPAGFDPTCSDSRVRPTYVVLACADAGSVAQDLYWMAWGGPEARAQGTLVENDCRPTCVNGTKHSYAATFRFHGLHKGRFTTVDVTFDKQGPNGEKHRTQRL
jgi:hypothetical protein